jgi:predicted ATP-dependent endonuclease of OLD family
MNPQIHILILDEPGVFLHADICRKLSNYLFNSSHVKTTLMSTHNKAFVSLSTLEIVRLVYRDGLMTKITIPPRAYCSDILFERMASDPRMTPIYFAQSVLLAEGEFDSRFLEALFEVKGMLSLNVNSKIRIKSLCYSLWWEVEHSSSSSPCRVLPCSMEGVI